MTLRCRLFGHNYDMLIGPVRSYTSVDLREAKCKRCGHPIEGEIAEFVEKMVSEN